MTKFGLVYPLWDHTAGAGNLLERALGEVGLDYLVIPAVTGAHISFRPHWFPETPTFETEGGWHFPFSAKSYVASGVKPHRARWTAQRDMLRDVLDVARAAKINVFFSIALQEIPPLLEAHPHLVQRNAWGEDAPTRRACLMNPATRALLRATLQDLERFEPAGFVLPDLSFDWNSRRLFPLSRFVQSTCFCSACREAATQAAADPDAAERSVRVLATRTFDGGDALREAIAADVVVRNYRHGRFAALRDWLDRIRVEFAPRTLLPEDLLITSHEDEVNPSAEERIVIRRRPVRTTLGSEFNDDTTFDAPQHISLSSRPYNWGHHSAELVQHIVGAQTAGAQYISVENVASVTPEWIDIWRQAVRYARREGGR